MMRHEREPTQPRGQRREELEVTSRRASFAERHLEAVIVTRELDLMRGRVGIAEARRTVDFQPEAARGGLTIAIAQIAEPPRVAGAVEELCVFQRDLTALARSDREHPRADQPLPGELDQRGIALLTDDGFIDGARLRRIHRFAAQLLIPLPEGVARENGLAGQREVIDALVQRGPVVAE